MYPSVPSILENALSLESSFHPLLPLNWHVWWSWNKKWWPEEIPSCFWYVSEHLRRTAFWASRFLRLESDGQLLGHEWLRGCLRSGAAGYWWNMRVRFCHRSCGVNTWKYFLCVNKLRSLLMIYNAVMIEPTVVPVPMGYRQVVHQKLVWGARLIDFLWFRGPLCSCTKRGSWETWSLLSLLEAFPRPDGTFSTIGGGVWILWIPAVLQGLFVSYFAPCLHWGKLRYTQAWHCYALLILPLSGDSFILQEAEKWRGLRGSVPPIYPSPLS